MKRIIRKCFSVLTIGLFLSCATNSSTLGLALGGGGAKCAFEVGVLLSLDSANVQVGYIAGSSMGALVGGLYAAGYSGKEIREMWLNEDWIQLFYNHSDDMVRNFVGVIDGGAFEESLKRVLKAKGCKTFDDLRIPFQCTATEIGDDNSLKDHVFKSGDLAKAIRASLSFPAPVVGFEPVLYDGKEYMDGGMLNNLPVDVVKDMGAKHVIAIDLETKKISKAIPALQKVIKILERLEYGHIAESVELAEAITNTKWFVNWEAGASETRHKNNLEMADIKIQDRSLLVNYNILSFTRDKIDTMICHGRKAMDGQIYKVSDLMQE